METINEAFKDKVLDLTVSGIYVYDLVRGINVYINQQYTSLTGYTLDDINGMTQEEFFTLFHPDEQTAIGEHMQEVITSQLGQVIEIEYRFKKADGNWIWCLSRDAVFDRDKDKNPTQFMGSFIDITDRKQAEKELKIFNQQMRFKNKELEQFAYVASHDLQEPLRTVNSFTELLEQQYKGQLDGNADKYLHYISQASTRMSALVKGLLDYSRIGRDKQLTHVDCNTIIKAVQDDLNSTISKTNTILDIGELPTIKGHERELRQLFQNLISNAIKYRKKDIAPQIKISAQKDGEHWKFSFRDNGIGIAEKHKEKIFVIFQRLHTTSEYEGTGIGLALCQKIAELHDGKIWVDSQPDKGSTFYITLPN